MFFVSREALQQLQRIFGKILKLENLLKGEQQSLLYKKQIQTIYWRGFKPGHNNCNPILVQFLFSNFKCKLMFVSPAFCYPFSLICFCFHCMNNISLIFSGLRLNCQLCKPFLHNWCCCTATRACVLIQPSKELTSLIGVLHQNSYHIYDGQLRVSQVHIKSCYETKWI